MPKNKPRKAMLKRIRFTKTGRIKHRRACGRHLRSHKPARLLRRYRRPAYATGSEARRVRAMLFTRVAVNVEKPKVENEG
ncbi:MAG: 50S ribosomal protein L35 [Planctomycetota bacterium]|nr:50S ribosomal protein L35 [Planctomycetota bacterium]